MYALLQMCERMMKLNEQVLLNQVLASPELQRWIIEMNQKQLFEQGINRLGIKLEDADKGGYTVSGFYKGYSPRTKEIKRKKGQPYDRVTLKDTGEFYASFRIELRPGELEIVANPMKDGESLFTRWGEEVLGLTEENMQKLIEFIREKIVQEIAKQIRGVA